MLHFSDKKLKFIELKALNPDCQHYFHLPKPYEIRQYHQSMVQKQPLLIPLSDSFVLF